MARVGARLRLWGWVTRRLVPIAAMSDAQVIALHGRTAPKNPVTNWIFGTVPAGIRVTSQAAPGPTADIPVRVYQPPAGAGAPRPLVLYIHGGGFALGHPDMGDWLCGSVAARVGAVVISVDYRLAPSHVFPAAVEDCYAALCWATDNAAGLGAGGPTGVMGESAGANLAAVMGLVARERGGPVLRHQALIYPATNMTGPPPALADPSPPFLSLAEILAYKRLYLGPDGDAAHPWVSPLLAADHSGLPPALIQVAEHDPLRADGERYSVALRAAGVPVRFTEYAGMPHGFVNFPGLSRAAHQALSEVCAEQSAFLAAPAADGAVHPPPLG
jgi:acetyl esterase/lipase